MLNTPNELASALGQRIKHRRLGFGQSQIDAAARAGIPYRTWRRLEEGRGSIDDLIRAAISLRCEGEIAALFPEPAATSMDALLLQQRAAVPKRRQRASPRVATS